MITINTETHFRCVLEQKPTVITLVGVGGTGSALAIDLARLVYHCRQQGLKVGLQLIDPDTVEEKNVGRQQFSPAEIGQNKAISMARRLNLWLGLDVVGLPERFTADTNLFGQEARRRVIVGAVDNWRARAQMAKLLKRANKLRRDMWWVDAGNGEFTGQVLVGNRMGDDAITIDEALGIVNGLPAPGLQMPALLRAEASTGSANGLANGNGMDCALAVIRDEQSLHINRAMAVYAAEAVTAIVLRREVATMATYVSLNPPSVTAVPLTAEKLAVSEQIKVTIRGAAS